MSAFELLLLVLLIAAVGLSIAAAATREVRWLSSALGTLALYLLCQFVNSH